MRLGSRQENWPATSNSPQVPFSEATAALGEVLFVREALPARSWSMLAVAEPPRFSERRGLPKPRETG